MAIYYVRPDGNNTNPGTGPLPAQAWATLTKAAQTAVAGDTVYVAPGKYFEIITPTNSGTNASTLITFIADVAVKMFTGLARGSVIVSTRASGAPYVAPTRTEAVNLSGKSYVKFVDFIFEKGSGGVSLSGVASGCIFVRCTFEGVLIATATAGAVLSEFYECNVKGYGQHQVSRVKFIRCTIGGYFTGAVLAMEIWFLFCHVHLMGTSRFDSAGAAGGNIYFFGSIITAYSKADSAAAVIYDTQGNIAYHFYGCYIKGLSRLINTTSASTQNLQLYGCLIEGMDMAVNAGSSSTALSFYYNHSKNVMYGINVVGAKAVYQSAFEDCLQLSPNANLGMNDCFIDRYCYLNGTLNNPTYGPIPEARKMGVFETVTDKIGDDEKSLKLKGYAYAPVQIFWIPCDENVAVTLKFKAKRSVGGAGTLPTFNFGDQETTMADNTLVQDITMTYTHHKKELVPFYVCARVGTSGTDHLVLGTVEVS